MQIFIGSTTLDVVDLYPDDLPEEWRFDYYYNYANALKLRCDTDEDLEEILSEFDDDEFKLVIDISTTFNLDKLLQHIAGHQESVVLYSDNTNDFAKINTYPFCISGASAKATHLKVLDNDVYYNNIPVITVPKPEDEKHIRAIIEELLPLNQDVVLLIDNADSEVLEKARIIVDLLT